MIRQPLRRQNYDEPAVQEFRRRTRAYYQSGESYLTIANRYGLKTATGLVYWIQRARVDLLDSDAVAA